MINRNPSWTSGKSTHFNPEDEGMFLRNVDIHLQGFTVEQEDHSLNHRRREHLKACVSTRYLSYE
jgi:hypothetical protein